MTGLCRDKWRSVFSASGLVLLAALVAGCATTGGGSQYMPPPIPEGKGHLLLETGGIPELNFYVIDQETEDEVYSFTPRASARSPSAYERAGRESRLQAYLDPGIYTVIVNTDFGETIEIPDVVVGLGEEKWVPVQVGRFLLNVTRDGVPAQVRFLLYDYNMRSVVGEGLSSTQLRHFITRTGVYKLRIEMLASGIDIHRIVEVNMGRVTPIIVELEPQEEEPPDQDPDF